jgi:ferredoxin-thioredoxin reductase catalytic chain
MDKDITDKEVEKLYEKLNTDAESGGYHLNPDIDFTKKLVKGLLINKKRYGYQACPCRLASGEKEKDLDIICPCDYRDPDLDEYGTCYCALYVDEEVLEGKKKVRSIPERRYKIKKQGSMEKEKKSGDKILDTGYPVWRCRVCGYLCARESPPAVCPICKAKKERFEKFVLRQKKTG